MKPINIGPLNYEWILNCELPVLVVYGAMWDLNSRKLFELLEDISDKYNGKIRTAKVDYDYAPEIFITDSISEFPTMAIFEDGKIFKKRVGYTGSNDLINFLNYYFGVFPY